MAIKKNDRTLPDSYFSLVKQFPLMHLEDDAHLEEAQAIMDRLLAGDLDQGEQKYLDVLTDLVEAYENLHVSIPDASEADVLRELMRAGEFSQARLSKAAGMAQSTISAVLNGNRTLTKEQVVSLAKVFHVSPNAFLKA